jgi:hypothetical protein
MTAFPGVAFTKRITCPRYIHRTPSRRSNRSQGRDRAAVLWYVMVDVEVSRGARNLHPSTDEIQGEDSSFTTTEASMSATASSPPAGLRTGTSLRRRRSNRIPTLGVDC